MGYLNEPGEGGGANGWKNANTDAHGGGNCPTAWTDLDLSAITGAARALVLLSIQNDDAATGITYSFRTNGFPNTDVAGGGSSAGGVSLVYISPQHHGVILVETDEAGIIEWYGNNAKASKVIVRGYIKGE